MAMSHLFHLHISNKKERQLIDHVMSVAAFLYPMMGIPQVISVFGGATEGISLASWIGFSIFSTLFLFYGILHNLRPIIVTQSLWLVIDLFVVIGVLAQ